MKALWFLFSYRFVPYTQSVSCYYKNIFCVCKYLRIYSLSTIVYIPLSKCDKIEKFITWYFFFAARKKWEYECCQLAEEDSFLQVFETISNLHLSSSYLIERLSYIYSTFGGRRKKSFIEALTNIDCEIYVEIKQHLCTFNIDWKLRWEEVVFLLPLRFFRRRLLVEW